IKLNIITFFFSSRRRHTRSDRDWSSDVCSSDLEKQAELKRFTTDANPVDDFAKSAPLIAVDPTVSLKLDETSWKKTLEDVTDLYRQYPDVQSVTASARFSAINEYVVNSEGTVTRCGKTT